jgi:hypothetical protein
VRRPAPGPDHADLAVPHRLFTLVDPIKLAELATAAGTRTVRSARHLALHGTTKDVTVLLTVVRSGATFMISGQVPVVFADYRIDNPSFGLCGPRTIDVHSISPKHQPAHRLQRQKAFVFEPVSQQYFGGAGA